MRQMLSIPDSDTTIIKHLEEMKRKNEDISKYIRKLIRNDIESSSFEDRVRQIVREELAGKIISEEAAPVDSEINNSILGILKGL